VLTVGLTYVHVGYIQYRMTDPLASLLECIGFDWDAGNSGKNWDKHRVSWAECEEVFFNEPLIAAPDEKHSGNEPRIYVLGQTDASRRLFVVVTIRDKLIRVISARDMSKREEKEYDNAQGEESSAQAPDV
jgi:uncharacterized protein